MEDGSGVNARNWSGTQIKSRIESTRIKSPRRCDWNTQALKRPANPRAAPGSRAWSPVFVASPRQTGHFDYPGCRSPSDVIPDGRAGIWRPAPLGRARQKAVTAHFSSEQLLPSGVHLSFASLLQGHHSGRPSHRADPRHLVSTTTECITTELFFGWKISDRAFPFPQVYSSYERSKYINWNLMLCHYKIWSLLIWIGATTSMTHLISIPWINLILRHVANQSLFFFFPYYRKQHYRDSAWWHKFREVSYLLLIPVSLFKKI